MCPLSEADRPDWGLEAATALLLPSFSKKDFVWGKFMWYRKEKKEGAGRQDHLHPIWTITKAESKYTALSPYPTLTYTQPQG